VFNQYCWWHIACPARYFGKVMSANSEKRKEPPQRKKPPMKEPKENKKPIGDPPSKRRPIR
jgi:hypothetical protein